ncbi:IS110 family RNA-guided transposase [Streptomyces halobius]|uniref:IS110 family transposase n=1 Tax=Streptomyces halobius TaxID=2879846 RepID=A0ABY4M2Y2_9ACTN|nr:IS110 family transposase [Streptomyces halobius]UQA92135.1 IS110 family transposase [Streptomyces halobius]
MEARHGVAGIDPHKHSATISLVDRRGEAGEAASFAVTPDGITELLGFLSDSELVIDRIGIEGSSSLGQPLALALAAAGYDVREVQPNRTAERRRCRRRAKTDIEDAEAIARETLSDPHLPPAGKHSAPDAVWDELTAIHDWRSSLVLQRTRQLNEAEAVLVSLPMAIRAELPATSRVLPQLEALETIARQQPEVSSATLIHIDRLVAALNDIRWLTRRIKDLDKKVPALLSMLGCTLTEICGIGTVTAMELLVEVGDPCRFRTEAQFARWCGAAPLAVSSGEGHGRARRHRLDVGGNRKVNSVLHIVHVTQVRCHEPARSFMARKISENVPKRSARRAHKRQLANVIIRHMWKDAERRTAQPPAYRAA